MSEDIRVLIPLPATRFTASTVVITKEPASGFAYVLLKMIGYGNRISSSLKVSEAMGVFSMAGDMVPLVLSQLDCLVKKGMIKCSSDRITKDTPVKNITFTKTGQEMFDRGFISSEPERIEKKMIFFPGRRNRFESDREMETVREKLTADEIDEGELGQFVLGDREYFGISPFADIISRVRANDAKSFIYNQPLFLHFDKDNGIFEVNEMLSGVKTESLKQLGTGGDEILAKIPAEKLQLPEAYGIETEWRTQDAGGYGFVLPCEVSMPEGIVLAAPGTRKSGSMELPDSEGCDLEIIRNSHEGYRYRFALMAKPLRDFECGTGLKVVLVKRMSQADIRTCLESVSADTDDNCCRGRIAEILKK